MRAIIFFFLLLICMVHAVQNVWAVSLSVDNPPTRITTSEFEISISITGAKPATNYLKILVSKEEGHGYVAKTWNGQNWYEGSNGKEYLPITVSGKTTTSTAKVQLPPNMEKGEYLLSVKRFTQSGNSADDTINPIKVLIELPSVSTPPPATPEPTLAPTPSMTPSPTLVRLETVEPTRTTTSTPHPVVLAENTQTIEPILNTDANMDEVINPSYPLFLMGIISFIIGTCSASFGSLWIFKRKRQLL